MRAESGPGQTAVEGSACENQLLDFDFVFSLVAAGIVRRETLSSVSTL